MKEMLQEYGRIIVSAIIIFIMLGLTVFFKGDYFINALSKLGVNTISYTLNGGTLPDDAVITYREYDEVVLPIPTNTKGTFEGWYETPDFTGEPVIKIEKGSTGDKVYYAKWNSESYAAVYGGTQLIFGIGAVPETYNGLELTKSWTGIETLQASSADAIPWKSYREAITDVVVIDEIQPVKTAYWFYNFKNCPSMNLTKLDTSKVTSMLAMFYCAGYNSSTFNIVGLDNWDVSAVTTMQDLFRGAGWGAKTWSIGNISGWDVSNVKNMNYAFETTGYSATSYNLDLSGWDVSNVTTMFKTFQKSGYNSSTFDLDLSGWKPSSCTTMENMFCNAGYSATTFALDLSGWNTSSVTNMNSMFNTAGYCAKNWSLMGLDDWDVSSVTSMGNMFCYVAYFVPTFKIDLSDWDVSAVKNMAGMFAGSGLNATSWSVGDLSRWDVSNVTNMSEMFYCYYGRTAKNWSVGDISGWDTSNVTNMYWMFKNAGTNSTVLNLDLSGWNVGKVTNHFEFNYGVGGKITPPVWVN